MASLEPYDRFLKTNLLESKTCLFPIYHMRHGQCLFSYSCQAEETYSRLLTRLARAATNSTQVG